MALRELLRRRVVRRRLLRIFAAVLAGLIFFLSRKLGLSQELTIFLFVIIIFIVALAISIYIINDINKISLLWAIFSVVVLGVGGSTVPFMNPDNRILAAIYMLLSVIYYLRVQKLFGEYLPKGDTVPLSKPPRNLSPAAMRFIIRMGYDEKCFIANMLKLVIKGRLMIIGEEDRYIIKPLVKPTKKENKDLCEDEVGVIPYETLTISKEFNPRLKELMDGLKGILNMNYGNYFKSYKYFAYIPPALYPIISFLISMHLLYLVLGLLILLIMGLIWGRYMKVPTEEGMEIISEIEGFRKYLVISINKSSDLDRNLLPYAYALDMEEAFRNQMPTLNLQDFENVFYLASTPIWLWMVKLYKFKRYLFN